MMSYFDNRTVSVNRMNLIESFDIYYFLGNKLHYWHKYAYIRVKRIILPLSFIDTLS